MKNKRYAAILALGFVLSPFTASAQTHQAQAGHLSQAEKTAKQKDDATLIAKSEQQNDEFNKRLSEIFKTSDPETKAAFKKALIAWMAYQRATGHAVITSYSEAGSPGGVSAASHCNIMTGGDFLKLLDQFFPKG